MEDKQPSVELVSRLRAMTGAPVTACRDALIKSSSDMEKAMHELCVIGAVKSASLQSRTAKDGTITSYIHPGNRIGVLIEVSCETDFTARTAEFQSLCKDLAMHIAGSDPTPLCVSATDIPIAVMQKQSLVIADKVARDHAGKPENMQLKIADGILSKWKKEVCLSEQKFVKDQSRTVKSVVDALSLKTGEKISIKRFCRYEIGRDD